MGERRGRKNMTWGQDGVTKKKINNLLSKTIIQSNMIRESAATPKLILFQTNTNSLIINRPVPPLSSSSSAAGHRVDVVELPPPLSPSRRRSLLLHLCLPLHPPHLHPLQCRKARPPPLPFPHNQIFHSVAAGTVSPMSSLPPYMFNALVHYAASAASMGNGCMPEADLVAISSAIRRRAPCNLLVFGLSHETFLWRVLNHGGRTVVLDKKF